MSHSHCKLYYHLVWSTEYRQPLITKEGRVYLINYLRRKIDNLRGPIREINVVSDHVHILTTVSSSVSVSQFVRRIKGSSSYEMKRSFGEDDFCWQGGYGVKTVLEKDIPLITKHTGGQQGHHRNIVSASNGSHMEGPL